MEEQKCARKPLAREHHIWKVPYEVLLDLSVTTPRHVQIFCVPELIYESQSLLDLNSLLFAILELTEGFEPPTL
jgi:hypothetical protein